MRGVCRDGARRSLEPLRAGADALDGVRTLLEQRLEALSSAPTLRQRAVARRHDGAAPFYTLLSPVQQRALFLEVASRPSAPWPRVRPLFKRPAYSFLTPGDAAALNAGDFAKGAPRT